MIRNFYLMNKNSMVIHFSIIRDVLGVSYKLIKNGTGIMPIDFTDMGTWISSRYIMSHRNRIEELFNSLGIRDIEDYIAITHCISVTDTFWIKECNQSITWERVSPYRNSINKNIMNYSFTGRHSHDIKIGSSPDFSTDGQFPKCWVKRDGKLQLIKAGSSGACNTGNEPYSEVFAYKLSKHLGLNAVEYKLGLYKGVDVCRCNSMCTEDIGLSHISCIIDSRYVDYGKLLNYVRINMSKVDYRSLIDMLLLDTLTCNIDRHYGNIGVMVNNDNQRVLGISKIYDNNLSCIPYYIEGENLKFYVDGIRANDGRTFNELYLLIKSSYTRRMCQKAMNFKFTAIGNKKADKRIKVLNKMLQYRINENLAL